MGAEEVEDLGVQRLLLSIVLLTTLCGLRGSARYGVELRGELVAAGAQTALQVAGVPESGAPEGPASRGGQAGA